MTNTVKTCSTCSSLLSPVESTSSNHEKKSSINSIPLEDEEQKETTVTTTTTTTIVDKTTMCQICLGLMDIDILPLIIEKLKPYNESINNCLINISLPSDILIRSHAVLSSSTNNPHTFTTDDKKTTSSSSTSSSSSSSSSPVSLTAERFVSELKDRLRNKLTSSSSHRRSSSSALSKNDEAGVVAIDITARVVVVVVGGSSKDDTATTLFPHGILTLPNKNNNNRHYHRGKRSRRQQHDNDGIIDGKQRTSSSSSRQLSTPALLKALADPVNTRPSVLRSLFEWLSSSSSSSSAVAATVDVALQRRPIYLAGRYVKRRRNISQTPFYVDGIRNYAVAPTSVEEEIVPFVVRHLLAAAKGDDEGPASSSDDPSSSSSSTTVVAPRCTFQPPERCHVKFHASGREDVNVRMLPPHGRRFGLELSHVVTLPSSTLLATVVTAINNRGRGDDEDGNGGGGVEVTSLEASTPSSFSSLQSDTEGKVKRYGCVCWSERGMESQEELDGLLSSSVAASSSSPDDDGNGNGNDDDGCRRRHRYPLPIDQKTPLRVLHRRANLNRRREIVTLAAEWINEHWFKLRISTSAGTYVKEFVHGDLGRTSPSVASMLGGKADIIQLDVLGIVDDDDGGGGGGDDVNENKK